MGSRNVTVTDEYFSSPTPDASNGAMFQGMSRTAPIEELKAQQKVTDYLLSVIRQSETFITVGDIKTFLEISTAFVDMKVKTLKSDTKKTVTSPDHFTPLELLNAIGTATFVYIVYPYSIQKHNLASHHLYTGVPWYVVKDNSDYLCKVQSNTYVKLTDIHKTFEGAAKAFTALVR